MYFKVVKGISRARRDEKEIVQGPKIQEGGGTGIPNFTSYVSQIV